MRTSTSLSQHTQMSPEANSGQMIDLSTTVKETASLRQSDEYLTLRIPCPDPQDPRNRSLKETKYLIPSFDGLPEYDIILRPRDQRLSQSLNSSTKPYLPGSPPILPHVCHISDHVAYISTFMRPLFAYHRNGDPNWCFSVQRMTTIQRTDIFPTCGTISNKSQVEQTRHSLQRTPSPIHQKKLTDSQKVMAMSYRDSLKKTSFVPVLYFVLACGGKIIMGKSDSKKRPSRSSLVSGLFELRGWYLFLHIGFGAALAVQGAYTPPQPQPSKIVTGSVLAGIGALCVIIASLGFGSAVTRVYFRFGWTLKAISITAASLITFGDAISR